jgi:RND superfamily putative drug exporter
MFTRSTTENQNQPSVSQEVKQMGSNNITGKLAFSARRRWAVLGVWVVVLMAAMFAAGGIEDVAKSDDGSGSNMESSVARTLINERINIDDSSQEYVLVEFENGTATSAANQAFISDLTHELQALEHVAGVVSYLDDVPGLVSADSKVALIPTNLTVADNEAAGIIDPPLTVVEEANETAGYSVYTLGVGSLNAEISELAEETMVKGESIGIGLALIILLVVFGAAVAAGLPILLALVSIIVAVALSTTIGRVIDINEFVVQIISMIGLAVGIDYALFIVKRYGEELGKGKNKIDAITTAGNTAGRTVMVSGIAVMIALAGMLIVPDMTFRSFGVGAIVVVIAAVAAGTTLLPAIISILGHRIYWLRVPFVGRKLNLQVETTESDNSSSFWDKITEVVTARPVMSVVLTGGALLAVSIAAFSMNLGSSGIVGILPEDSPTRHAHELVNTEFSNGLLTSDIVIDTNDPSSATVQAGIASLEADLAADPFFGDTEVVVAPDNSLVVLKAVMQGDSVGEEAEAAAAVARIREQYIPSAFADTSNVYVGGDAAYAVDAVAQMNMWLPIVIGLVLSSSFVLLLVIFRSIVVPIKAVLMNVLSVGAAYGLMVLVFQEGIGADLLGFQTTPVIEYGLPLFLFSILFGLSMDYHVFLLSRIKEHYDLTGDNKASVAFGLRSTARIITGAALIMVGVFGGFATGDMSVFQQMGFGLAAAVIIDATLVRSILIPASMVLLGDKNWYFPSWLEWIPRIDVEGESQETDGRELVPGTASPVFAQVPAVEGAGD